MNDLIMLGSAAAFAFLTWQLILICDRLMGGIHERK